MNDKILLPIEKLDNTGTLVGEVFYKPTKAIIYVSLAALLLALTRNWLAILLGVFILGVALVVNYIIKDRITLGIYQDYVIVYASEDPTLARKISYSELAEWDCKTDAAGADAIMLKLVDGEIIYKDTFQAPVAFRLLRQALPEKETRKIKAEQEKKKKLKFDNPFKRWNKK